MAEQSVELIEGGAVALHRSARRRKTIEARFDEGVLHVYLPDNLSRRKELEWVETMRRRVIRQEDLRRARRDIDLDKRARDLNRRYFRGRLRWQSIEFVPEQLTRYGWCDSETREIRISAELATLPRWVLDYVIVHELAHLVDAGHGRGFWEAVGAYPHTERARGFLLGHAHSASRSRQGPPGSAAPAHIPQGEAGSSAPESDGVPRLAAAAKPRRPPRRRAIEGQLEFFG